MGLNFLYKPSTRRRSLANNIDGERAKSTTALSASRKMLGFHFFLSLRYPNNRLENISTFYSLSSNL
jgi:hypothetical protein